MKLLDLLRKEWRYVALWLACLAAIAATWFVLSHRLTPSDAEIVSAHVLMQTDGTSDVTAAIHNRSGATIREITIKLSVQDSPDGGYDPARSFLSSSIQLSAEIPPDATGEAQAWITSPQLPLIRGQLAWSYKVEAVR